MLQDLGLYEELVNIINTTSIILYKQEEFINALKLNKSAFVICKANTTYVFMGDVLLVKALLEIASAKFDKALLSCEKAIGVLKKDMNDPDQNTLDHFGFLYEKDGETFSKFQAKKSLAEIYYLLGLANKGINFNTAAMEAFSMALNLYKTFDEHEDYEMQKRLESQIRSLSIINNSFQKEVAQIKEYCSYKHLTGRRPVGHISAPLRNESDELILQHKVGERIQGYYEPYLQKLPKYNDVKAAGNIADPVKRAVRKEEEFVEYLEKLEFDSSVNQSSENSRKKTSSEFSPEKSKGLPGPNYISDMKEKIMLDVRVRNAIKRDDIYRSTEGKVRHFVYQDHMANSLPEDFSNLKHLMSNDNFQNMEYFATMDNKNLPKVEAPWENPNLNM